MFQLQSTSRITTLGGASEKCPYLRSVVIPEVPLYVLQLDVTLLWAWKFCRYSRIVVVSAVVISEVDCSPFPKMLATFFATFRCSGKIATFATFFIFANYFATFPQPWRNWPHDMGLKSQVTDSPTTCRTNAHSYSLISRLPSD